MLPKCLIAAGAVALLAGTASAHDFDAEFTTKSACMQALQDINKVDYLEVKDWLKEFGGEFGLDGPGQVRAFLAQSFKCEKVGSNWKMVYVGG